MSTEEEKQTDALEEIKETTEESASVLHKFGDVFSSINASIMHQSRIMGEMLRLQSEQFEIERRREQLESVSSAPEPVVPQPVVTLPDNNASKPNVVDDKKGGGFISDLLTNFMGSLFGNMLGNGGAVASALGIGAGGLIKFLKVGAIVAFVAPWVADFVSESFRLLLENTDLSEETKSMATEFAGSAAYRSVVGGALYGWRGALIGAVSSVFDVGLTKMAELIGIDSEDLQKNAATIFGFDISWENVKDTISVGLAALATTVGPQLLKFALRGLVGAVAGILGAPAWLAGLGVIATGFLAKLGYDYINSKREELLSDAEAKINESANLDFSDNSGGVGFWGRTKGYFGWGSGAEGGAGVANDIYNATMGMSKDGIDADEKQSILEQLSSALSKASTPIDLNNPQFTADNMNYQNAQYIIDTLKALGENGTAQKWQDEANKLRDSSDYQADSAPLYGRRMALEDSLARAQMMSDDDPNKAATIRDITDQLREVGDSMRDMGIPNVPLNEFHGTIPQDGSPTSSITPIEAIPRLAEATATANEAGNNPSNATITVVSNVGNSYVAQGGPSNVSTNIIQKQTSIFGGGGDLSSGGIIAGS